MLCGPAACGCCGHDLTGEPVLGTVQKRQVFEASPPPPPTVTEYQVAAKQCPECGVVSVGLAPAGVTGRVQYGPGVHAKAALVVCAHYLPVARAARLVAALTGVNVSAGFVAGIRGKAARLLAPFMNRVRELLHAAPVLYADETPARAAGTLRYVHVACTEFLTAMHTGDRTSEAIDAGGILPGYPGTIVRDGYKGYEHLTDALHAWCGAHGLRDLAGLYRFDPDGQVWARSMADLLIDANGTATAARSAGQASLSDASLTSLRSWYRGAVAKGIADNQHKRTQIAKDGLRLARRFRDHEDMILRFATDLTVGFTSNQAERDIRPVKVQQRTSGGTWRTLLGLADFGLGRGAAHAAGRQRPVAAVAAGARDGPAGRVPVRAAGRRALHPRDAVLNLPPGGFSWQVRKLAEMTCRSGTYESAREIIEAATGVVIGKRQLQEMMEDCAAGAEAFAEDRPVPQAAGPDGPGRAGAGRRGGGVRGRQGRQHAARTRCARTRPARPPGRRRRTPGSSAPGRRAGNKRIAETGVVYDCVPPDGEPRTAEEIMHRPRGEPARHPQALNRSYTCGIVSSCAAVIACVFAEIDRRDPARKRQWIALADGNTHQIDDIPAQKPRNAA